MIKSIITTEYTDFKREESIHRYNGDGTLKNYDEYEYDSNNNLIKISSYDAEGNLKHYTTFVTDESGLTTEYEYDANGNLIGTN